MRHTTTSEKKVSDKNFRKQVTYSKSQIAYYRYQVTDINNRIANIQNLTKNCFYARNSHQEFHLSQYSDHLYFLLHLDQTWNGWVTVWKCPHRALLDNTKGQFRGKVSFVQNSMPRYTDFSQYLRILENIWIFLTISQNRQD